MTYRITQTIVRGQWANNDCFLAWLSANVAGAVIVRAVADPLNNGGPNDKNYFLWNNIATVQNPKCASDPQLVTRAGKNGWETLAEANAVLDYELGQSKVVADNVKVANEAAVSVGNIAAGVASDIKKDVGAVADSIGTSPWFWIGLAAAGAGVVVAIKVLK
jgi:hypothetical protein